MKTFFTCWGFRVYVRLLDDGQLSSQVVVCYALDQ